MDTVATDALTELERAYRDAQARVVETALDHVQAREDAIALRRRYVEAHAALLKESAVRNEDGTSFSAPPRVMPGTLPGGTAAEGLRMRWLTALGSRW